MPGGDYTRFSYKAKKDYIGPLRMQARVGIDADPNEFVEAVDRRWRSETIDIMGRCVVPISDPTNQHAFEITPISPNTFDIGMGRMYVDGLVAECRGPEPHDVFDRSVGELKGTGALPYDQQPYLPNPVRGSGPGVTDLIYIDCWHREVSAIEDPEIREIALGGPDTSTRVQSVWQVKVLQRITAETCRDDIQAWTDLIAASTGRLTTEAIAAPSSADPCVTSPTGGYRGLTNRLYRVEVHEAGSVNGGATFKWSRDNASVVSSVEKITGGNRLMVSRIGRDRELRFKVGDWVEVMDDPTEFDLEPGHMARVTAVDEANRTITVTPNLPPKFNPGQARNHTRVRRWDQRQNVNGDGVLAVTDQPFDLEDGIRITFGADGDTLRVGDYWVFAARTVDASVEELAQDPPRGIHHHYCKLAVITWDDTWQLSSVEDCRTFWPPGGCCTEVVWPGENRIQPALDRLPPEGGCVCLKAGVHLIDETLRIGQSNVVIHGESLGAIVRSRKVATLLTIGDAGQDAIVNVRVEEIRFETEASEVSGVGLIEIYKTEDPVVRSCELSIREDGRRPFVGIFVADNSDGARIEDNQIDGFLAGILGVGVTRVHILHNRLRAPELGAGLLAGTQPSQSGIVGIFLWAADGLCSVEGNEIAGYWTGIGIQPESVGAVIARNRIERFPTRDQAPAIDIMQQWKGPSSPALGLLANVMGHPIPSYFYAIDCAAASCLIVENRMNLTNEKHGGIHITASHTRAEGNEVLSEAHGWDEVLPVGIFVDGSVSPSPPQQCVVLNNRLDGYQNGITLRGTETLAALATFIGENRFSARGRWSADENKALADSRHAIGVFDARDTVVYLNEILGAPNGILLEAGSGNSVFDNTIINTSIGVYAMDQQKLTVSRNRLNGTHAIGIELYAVDHTTVVGNTIDNAGRGIALVYGWSNRVLTNQVVDGTSGIFAVLQRDLVVESNCVENEAECAIAGLLMFGDAMVRQNKVSWCGYAPHDSVPAAGICFLYVVGTFTVDGCEVLETGRSRDAKAEADRTCGILGLLATDLHIHGNRVENSRHLKGIGPHWSIVLLLGGAIELLDNYASGDARNPLVRIGFLVNDPRLIFRQAIVSNNRCVHNVRAITNNPPDRATVEVGAAIQTVIGNQIRADTNVPFAYKTAGNPWLSASGNITSGYWDVPGGAILSPMPLTSFNHIHIP